MSFQLFDEYWSDNEHVQRVKKALESQNDDKDHLGKAIELAWKFVTLSNPLIVCQPEVFDERIHCREFDHWDKKKPTSKLIYTRPVVFRNYAGRLASQGWVANTDTD